MIEARPPASARYLVSYSPSGTMFAWLQECGHERKTLTPAPHRLLALGDPSPLQTAEARQPAAVAMETKRSLEALVRAYRGATFEPLPGTRLEVQSIAALFNESTVLLGSDASEQALEALRTRGQLASFDVIHLATHGRVDDLAPMNSRLLLAQDRLPDPLALAEPEAPAFDGNLTAGEVMSTWRLDADLVNLSACRSGLGRQSGGEGYVGFAQAFFLAGCRSLLVSLWEVDDLRDLVADDQVLSKLDGETHGARWAAPEVGRAERGQAVVARVERSGRRARDESDLPRPDSIQVRPHPGGPPLRASS